MGIVRSRLLAPLGALAALSLVTSAFTLTSAGASSSPVKIAIIYSKTGVAAAESADGPQGFLARVDLQNARGGINGHKIIPLVLDDQSSTGGVVTATKLAISEGAIGIVADTAFFFVAAKYPQEAGIPVTGGSYDGFEWGTQPYTNMFASDQGSGLNPNAPYNLAAGTFFKSHGGTVVASYGYGISPSSTYGANATAKAGLAVGMKLGVLDTTVPFGSNDFSTQALAAKSAGVNSLYGAMDNNSNFALATAIEQAGQKLKVIQFPTGYEPDIIGSSSWQAVQGAYFATGFRPTAIPNAGTVQMAAALATYVHRKPAAFPTFAIYEGWLGADLMIKGIGLAGSSPTSAQVISQLRKVTSYNGSGILPINVDFATNFGTGNPVTCTWYMQAKPKGFVPASKAPDCGKVIPGSSSKTPPQT
jgi:branched-chain amino acid transport system substrate-binding protein